MGIFRYQFEFVEFYFNQIFELDLKCWHPSISCHSNGRTVVMKLVTSFRTLWSGLNPFSADSLWFLKKIDVGTNFNRLMTSFRTLRPGLNPFSADSIWFLKKIDVGTNSNRLVTTLNPKLVTKFCILGPSPIDWSVLECNWYGSDPVWATCEHFKRKRVASFSVWWSHSMGLL